ncbi:MAG: PqqD family peptide modification chaperone, partial [Thermoplasmatota archaeon]
RLGKKFCKVLRRQDTFQADMDMLGSFIWQRCDGKRSVEEILNELKKGFPNEKNIDQRLFYFLIQMRQLEYLYF